MQEAILRAVWVAAILYMRSPAGRKHKKTRTEPNQPESSTHIWSWIDAVAMQFGYPCAPMTASWMQK